MDKYPHASTFRPLTGVHEAYVEVVVFFTI